MHSESQLVEIKGVSICKIEANSELSQGEIKWRLAEGLAEFLMPYLTIKKELGIIDQTYKYTAEIKFLASKDIVKYQKKIKKLKAENQRLKKELKYLKRKQNANL